MNDAASGLTRATETRERNLRTSAESHQQTLAARGPALDLPTPTPAFRPVRSRTGRVAAACGHSGHGLAGALSWRR